MPIDETVERLIERHFPSLKITPPGAKDQRPRKRCRVCYARGIRSDKGHPLKTIYMQVLSFRTGTTSGEMF